MSKSNRQPPSGPRPIQCPPEQRVRESTRQINSSSQQNDPSSAQQRPSALNQQTHPSSQQQAKPAQKQQASATQRQGLSTSQQTLPSGQQRGITTKNQAKPPGTQQGGSNTRQEGLAARKPRPRSTQHTQSSSSQDAPNADLQAGSRPEQRVNRQPPPSVSHQARLAAAQGLPTTPQVRPVDQLTRPPATQGQGRPTPNQGRPSHQQEALPVYIPSKLPQFQNITPTIRADPQAEAAAKLDLSRRTIHPTKPTKKTPNAPTPSNSRKHQRPWTLREWSFVSQVPKNIDSNGMRDLMCKFQERFKWTPSEGQLTSQHWYFMKGEREMKAFLRVWEQHEERRMGIKLGDEGGLVTKLRTMTLRPSW